MPSQEATGFDPQRRLLWIWIWTSGHLGLEFWASGSGLLESGFLEDLKKKEQTAPSGVSLSLQPTPALWVEFCFVNGIYKLRSVSNDEPGRRIHTFYGVVVPSSIILPLSTKSRVSTLLFINHARAICCTKTTLCPGRFNRRPLPGRRDRKVIVREIRLGHWARRYYCSDSGMTNSATRRKMFIVCRGGQLTRGTDQSLRDCPSLCLYIASSLLVTQWDSLLFKPFSAQISHSLSYTQSYHPSQIPLLYPSIISINTTSPIV